MPKSLCRKIICHRNPATHKTRVVATLQPNVVKMVLQRMTLAGMHGSSEAFVEESEISPGVMTSKLAGLGRFSCGIWLRARFPYFEFVDSFDFSRNAVKDWSLAPVSRARRTSCRVFQKLEPA